MGVKVEQVARSIILKAIRSLLTAKTSASGRALSRYGKAALVAMAYDARFAIGFIGSSGAGGAKILRRKFGEQVENLASTSEYHWFDGNFLKYAGPMTASELPVDAHELTAPLRAATSSSSVSSGSQVARRRLGRRHCEWFFLRIESVRRSGSIAFSAKKI